MIYQYEKDECSECDSKHSLYIIDENGNHHKMYEVGSIMDSIKLDYIKCSGSKQKYNIEWKHDGTILPIRSSIRVNNFLKIYRIGE